MPRQRPLRRKAIWLLRTRSSAAPIASTAPGKASKTALDASCPAKNSSSVMTSRSRPLEQLPRALSRHSNAQTGRVADRLRAAPKRRQRSHPPRTPPQARRPRREAAPGRTIALQCLCRLPELALPHPVPGTRHSAPGRRGQPRAQPAMRKEPSPIIRIPTSPAAAQVNNATAGGAGGDFSGVAAGLRAGTILVHAVFHYIPCLLAHASRTGQLAGRCES